MFLYICMEKYKSTACTDFANVNIAINLGSCEEN